ncbi:MAG: ABC transporter ATP-binding protein [Chloroflexi bacterium]|nr:ABC transporter ATP-binding protein [Chloroflexota bacterium]MBI5079976.1 ABC transporter ATP-binding protein [Chloroflexota bacterium]MBI5712522.1 ABC transporter ATP-binding protein [Chloroflexota bacterium]
MSTLQVTNLESGYGEVQILWSLSLGLQPGKLTSLVGSNGSGKTTLLRAVTGLIKPWKGNVMFDGKDVTKISPHEKAEMGLVLVPEARQLFTDMSVLENLEMGATPKAARAEFAQTLEWVYSLLPRLKERQNQLTGTLSGGEQQMVAIARGLMAKPKVLMFDELSLGLSPLLVINLFEVLLKLKTQGLTMLLVEQNVQMALAVSDYAYVLSNGRVDIEGESRTVMGMESVRKAYLGI